MSFNAFYTVEWLSLRGSASHHSALQKEMIHITKKKKKKMNSFFQ